VSQPAHKVYVSGPMTGLPDLGRPAFDRAAAVLRAGGLHVVSPAEVVQKDPHCWRSCMRADLRLLLDCSAIVMLPGWESSRGARLELQVAHELGLCVFFASDLGEVVP
jgi:hypothetical protein